MSARATADPSAASTNRLEATVVVGEEALADIAQRGRILLHQRQRPILSGDRGEIGRFELGQLSRRPRPDLTEALGEPRCDREVTAVPGPLADLRPPAGTEVDRVEADYEGDARLSVPLGEVGRGIGRWQLGRGRQAGGVGRDRALVDPHRLCRGGN